jgi:3'(2'), 5'-bisphosphate nucleotidase
VDDSEYAASLARDAGRLLVRLRASSAEQVGTDDLKDRADRASQAFLADRLSTDFPHDSVLSEEAADDSARLGADRVWIVDPLDGTREFAEGRIDWAVHVALWSGHRLIAGAVALPALDEVMSTGDAPRAFEPPARLRLAVSRSRASDLVTRVAGELDAELVPMGSAGYKVAAVVRGEVDAYLHSGGQFEWDSAAPVAVAAHATLFTSRLDGSALTYNNRDPYLPDLVVCNPHIAERVLEAVHGCEMRIR